jgi:hypothetical protein
VQVLHAMTLQSAGRHDEAVGVLDRAYTAQSRRFGAEHPGTQLVSVHRARALWSLNRPSEALEVLDRALPILEKAMGADAPAFVRIAALRTELSATKPETPAARRKVDLFV